MPKYKGKFGNSVEMAVFPIRMAAALSAIRKRDRIKMKDLAKRVGISNTHMTKIVRGEANISLGLLYCFCRELNVPVTDLIGERADGPDGVPRNPDNDSAETTDRDHDDAVLY